MKSGIISIIIPTLSAIHELKDCLQSISTLSYPKSKLEVIIIDNGLSRKISFSLQKKYPQAIFIKNATNQSFARSINQGIHRAKGEFICITNDDVTFEKESLQAIANYLTAHPKVGISGGKIYAKTSPQKVISSGYSMNRWTGAIAMQPDVEKIKEVDWIQGCLMAVRKSTLTQIGYLDEAFPFFFEDFDLCVRAKAADWSIVYLPSAIFWHANSTTVNTKLTQKHTRWYQSKFRFILKHLSLLQIVSIVLLQTCIVMPYRYVILRDGRGLAFLKGIAWNLYHLPQTAMLRNLST